MLDAAVSSEELEGIGTVSKETFGVEKCDELESRGPALVCGRRGIESFRLLLDDVGLGGTRGCGGGLSPEVLVLGTGSGLSSSFLRVRRGDLDLDRASEED